MASRVAPTYALVHAWACRIVDRQVMYIPIQRNCRQRFEAAPQAFLVKHASDEQELSSRL